MILVVDISNYLASCDEIKLAKSASYLHIRRAEGVLHVRDDHYDAGCHKL